MRIKSIRIRNLRTFSDVTIPIDALTAFVGANGAGKSTVLCALNIFFREAANSTDVLSLGEEDFHFKQTGIPISITVTFNELSAQALEDLSDYARNGELVVTAEAKFDVATGRAQVKQFGERLGMTSFRRYFEADKDKASAEELKRIYGQLVEAEPQLPAVRTKDAMAAALREFEAQRPDRCELIQSEDEFYGIRGSNKLRPYIQWVYIPAVKDASDEQIESKDSALGKLLARTVRTQVDFRAALATLQAETEQKYAEILAEGQGALEGVSTQLSEQLAEWSHPEVSLRIAWQKEQVRILDPSARAIAGEAGFEGDLARFGHGFQRSYLLALLRVLAAAGSEGQPTLLLGCEEPELYQHPPQARYLASVMRTLAEENAQILLTTHSPYFVSGEGFSGVRLVRRTETGAATCAWATYQQFSDMHTAIAGAPPRNTSATMAQVNEILRPGLNEMFFARKLVLVEGTADIAAIASWMSLQGRIGDLRRSGVHIVQVGGKEFLVKPAIIAKLLGIPVYVVFDSDRDAPADKLHHHERDNRALLRMLEADEAVLFPELPIVHAGFATWPECLDSTLDGELRESMAMGAFDIAKEGANAQCGHAGSLRKNSIFIREKLERCHAAGGRSASMDSLCDRILEL